MHGKTTIKVTIICLWNKWTLLGSILYAEYKQTNLENVCTSSGQQFTFVFSLLPCVGQFNLLSGTAIIFQKQGRHTQAAPIAHILKSCFKEKSSIRVRRRCHSWLSRRLERNTRTRFVEFRPNSCHVLGMSQRQLPHQVSIVLESKVFSSISALLLPVLLQNFSLIATVFWNEMPSTSVQI